MREKANGVGQFARNPNWGILVDALTHRLMQILTYVRDGEVMRALEAAYKVNNELSVGARTNYSEFSYSGERLKQRAVLAYLATGSQRLIFLFR